MLRFIFIAMVSGAYFVNAQNEAVVVLSNSKTVTGTIKFKQTEDGVTVEGTVSGLTPNNKHGFHIHAKGDLSDGCTSAGAHFNPFNKSHGAPDVSERHVGDLGNIVADENGVATIQTNDSEISLKAGDRNIIGRAVVVHEGEDDLGLGGHDDSLTTGHAGGRIACGVIGIASNEWDWKSAGTARSSNIILMSTIIIISSIFISKL